MNYRLAPIALFTYKRLDTLKQAVEALKKCDLANESELIIFSDAAKGEKDSNEVGLVREYLKSIEGFKNIDLRLAETNKGLANSIIGGVSSVIKQYGKIIVMEDDLIASANFLVFMNQALDHYKNNKGVFSLSGYSIPVKVTENYPSDVYFTPRSSSWGWATWSDRWEGIDWEVKDYPDFRKNNREISGFNRGGSDLSGMLKRQMEGRINSWAIRWCYYQYKTNTFTVYPVISKIKNIGFSNKATHSNVYNRYKTILDDGLKNHFLFPDEIKLQPYLLSQFQNFFSVKTRLYNKLKTYLYKTGVITNNND